MATPWSPVTSFYAGRDDAEQAQRRNQLIGIEQQQQGQRNTLFDQSQQDRQAAQGAAASQAELESRWAELAQVEASPPEYQEQWANEKRQANPQLANMPTDYMIRSAKAGLAARLGKAAPQPQYRDVSPGSTVVEMGQGGPRPVYTAPDRPKPAGPPDAPSGYRWGPGGKLEPIPGGPSDPAGPGARRNTQPLRKEFRALPSVRDYETALPILKSAEKAPDNGYGDLQLIYTVGKLLDPNSVVREGELALTIAAGSPLQRIIGTTRFTTEQGGRLTPQVRQQIMGMLQERIGAYKQAYERDFAQYSEYATEQGVDPSMVVGKHAESAYAPKGNAPAAPASASGWSIKKKP